MRAPNFRFFELNDEGAFAFAFSDPSNLLDTSTVPVVLPMPRTHTSQSSPLVFDNGSLLAVIFLPEVDRHTVSGTEYHVWSTHHNSVAAAVMLFDRPVITVCTRAAASAFLPHSLSRSSSVTLSQHHAPCVTPRASSKTVPHARRLRSSRTCTREQWAITNGSSKFSEFEGGGTTAPLEPARASADVFRILVGL